MKPHPLKILMLEDNSADAAMIQRQLHKAGIDCEFKLMMTREAYELALAEFKPDIILSDNAMPQFSALEALQILQQHQLHTPFILVTGTVSEEFAAGIIKSGADDYLLKDRLTRLPAAIETALKQKQTAKENKEALDRLKQSEEKYRSMMERVTHGFVALDTNWNYTYVNKMAGEILGRKPYELVGKNIWEEFPEGVDKPFYKGYHKAFDEQRYIQFEEYYPPFDLWLDNHIYPSPDGVSIYFSDVTAKKKAEQKIVNANRLYFFISQINQMIVRTTDEATLFEEVCRIAVEVGKFKMAWIGMVDPLSEKVIPINHAGEEKEYLDKIKPISIRDVPEGRGPTGTALREGNYIICNDIENDASMLPWKEAALGRDYRSSMSLPIKKSGVVVGAFSVYASEKNFFDDTEITLLEEATGDVSFALEVFEKEALRKKAEEAVSESEMRYHTLTEMAPVGIFHTNAEGITTYVNPKWCNISGLSPQMALGNGWLDAVHQDDKEALIKGWQNATNLSQTSLTEYRFIRPDGTTAWVFGQAIPERNAENQIIGYVGTITDITERKMAEKQIFAEKELSDKIINSLPGIFYLSDATPKLLRWNKALEKISGFTKEEIEQRRPITLFDPEDHQVLRNGLEKSYTDGSAEVEVRLLTKNGQKIPFYFTGVSIEYNGRPAVLGTGIDITELKKAEEEIKKSNERFELIAKATHDGLWDWNLETGKLWGNEVHQQLYGLTLADPVPNHEEWKSRIHPEDRERTIQAFENAKASTQSSYIDEYRFYAESQGWMNIYGRTLIQRNEKGIPVRLIGSMMDITERKKAEELLAANEKRFRKLVENGNDAFAILNPEGRAIYISSSVQKVLGYTEEEMYQMNMFSLVHPNNIQEVQKTLQKVMINPGVPVAGHISRLKHKDGTWRWFEDTITNLVDDPDIGGIVDNFRDVTERIKAEEKLLEQKMQLETLSNNLPGVMIYQVIRELDGSMKFTYISDGVIGLIGKTPKEVIEDPSLLYKPVVDEDMAKLIAAEQQSFLNMSIFHEEVRFKTHEGKTRWLNIVSVPRKLNDGRTVWDGFHVDVTDRKIREEEIKTSEEKRRLIMNAALDAIVCMDTAGIITFWNPQAEKIFGWHEDEVMGKRLSEMIIPEQFRKMHEAGMEKYFRTGEAPVLNRLLELNAINRQNEEFPIELTVLPIKQGGEEFFCAFIRDIRERIKAQNEILKEKNLSDSIINSLPGVFYLYNREGKFLRWNTNFEKVSLYTAQEIREMHPLDFYDDDEKELMARKINNVFTNGEDEVQSNFLSKTKEKIPYYFTGIAIDYENQPCLMGVGIDFSEREKAQHEIEETTEKLRELTAHLLNIREEERKRIGREIHDELGQQLTAIKMDVSWIDKKIPDTTAIIKNKLKNIIMLLDGSNQSIRRILSELRPGILDDYGLIEALEWLNNQFTANTGIPVEFITGERELKLPETLATCIFRVYQEAFTNITRHSGATKVFASVTINNGTITVVIEDNGKGFETIAAQKKKSFGILGIKERVFAQGGNIELSSELGKGTKLVIRLPFGSNKNILN